MNNGKTLRDFLGKLSSVFSLLVIILTLSTCFSPWQGEEAAFTINLGGNGRAVVPWPGVDPASISQLHFLVSFSSSGKVVKSFSTTGSDEIKGTIALGTYTVDMVITVAADGTLYARGAPAENPVTIKAGQNNIIISVIQTEFTVSFDPNGGSGTIPSLTAKSTNPITIPGGTGFTNTGYNFDGWNTRADGSGTTYNAADPYTPIADTVLYARWNAISPVARIPSTGLSYATLWEAIEAAPNGTASAPTEIVIMQNITLPEAGRPVPVGPDPSYYDEISANKHIQLAVNSGNSFSITGAIGISMFKVNGGSLTLGQNDGSGGNLTLSGDNLFQERGVYVLAGTLTMNSNVTLTGFSNAVGVWQQGYFLMRGGRIEHNTITGGDGGGILVYQGNFRMEGGFIANNSRTDGGASAVGGGVVLTYGGRFVFVGGTIYGTDDPGLQNTPYSLRLFFGGAAAEYDDGTPLGQSTATLHRPHLW